MKTIRDLVLENPPRCIAETDTVETAPIDERGSELVAFSLLQKATGQRSAAILGYPLADYNPACAGDPDFISPLSLVWPDGSTSPVFDSEIHGYHGEMGSSAKLRGEGEPQRFRCPACGHDSFEVDVQFDYLDAVEDLREDEPDLPIQDYFCNVIFAATCLECGERTNALDMDL